MEGIDIANIVTIVVALFGGGVVGVAIKAFAERKKVNAETTNTNIKSILEIDQRMNERMAKLEERVGKLEAENYALKTEKLKLEKETHKLEAKIDLLEKENTALINENSELKKELEQYNHFE